MPCTEHPHLTTSPVPAGKFEPLREMAAQHGMTLEARYIEALRAGTR
jgi:cobaltochelatase CobN